MKRLRRRYGRAAVKGPLAAFHTAARKVERMIADFAEGGDLDTPIGTIGLKISEAINRLDDRTSKPEIRGDDALREEAWAVVRALRAKKQAAEEAAYGARQRRRGEEIAGIRERERAERAAMDPAFRQYQDELKLRGGR